MYALPARIRGVVLRLLMFVAIAAMTRCVLFIAHFDQVTNPTVQFIKSMAAGLLFDLSIGLLVLAPHLLWMLFSSARQNPAGWWIWIRRATNFLFIFMLTYGAVVEFFFFDEFNARFNYVAVDYLLFPHEVFINIWDSYPVAQALIAVLAAAYALHRLTFNRINDAFSQVLSCGKRIAFGCLYAGISAVLFGSINITTAQVSPNRVVNELALNGYYSFAPIPGLSIVKRPGSWRPIVRIENAEDDIKLSDTK